MNVEKIKEIKQILFDNTCVVQMPIVDKDLFESDKGIQSYAESKMAIDMGVYLYESGRIRYFRMDGEKDAVLCGACIALMPDAALRLARLVEELAEEELGRKGNGQIWGV